MSMLGAFFRGAAGAGLVDYANRLDRRDAMAAEDERRKREREEERAWRSSEAEKDRLARAESAAIRSGGRRSGSGSGGGDGEGGDDAYAVAAIMKKFNVSEGKARQLLEANRADMNPFGMAVGGDDVGPPQADTKRWSELNSAIAESLRAGPSMARSNYEQLTAGDINAQRGRVNEGMLGGKLTMRETAEAQAAMSGKGAFGNARTNEFTGDATAIGQSEIRENNAQAGSASRANRDKPESNKPNIKWLEDEYKTVTQEIAKARAAGVDWNPRENPEQQALLDRALDLEGQLRAAGGAAVDNKAIGAGVQAVLDAARKAKDAGAGRPAGAASPPGPAGTPVQDRKPQGMLKTSADPLAGLGRQEIREKRAELVNDLKRWQGNPNAKARVAEIQELIDRIDQGRY
jgi:hypothetical protein